MKLSRLTKHGGSTVDQYDMKDVDAVVVEETWKADRDEDKDSSDERQTGRKGDKQAAGAAVVVMDRAARCSQPATRNVGDPPKRLLRQNQSWLSKVRVAQLGNPTVRQSAVSGGSIKTIVTMIKTGRRNKRPRRAAMESKNRVHERPHAGPREHPQGKTDDDDFPSHI
jgi:hypothetical protein